mgnify:CR=1 FL=1
MGDTDVNIEVTRALTHCCGGVMQDTAGFSIRVHLGNASVDATLSFNPQQARLLLVAAHLDGPDSWASDARPGRTELADLGVVNEALMRHSSWYGLTQTLGVAHSMSAAKSLVMALRYPHG